MVTIQVSNLIDFVAEVFSRSKSSAEETRRIAKYLTSEVSIQRAVSQAVKTKSSKTKSNK